VREHHAVDVSASPDVVYRAVREFDLSNSRIVRTLLRIRGMPKSLSLSRLKQLGFTELASVPSEELVLGVVGAFWKRSGEILRVGADDFRAFNRSGYAKAVWNFHIAPRDGHVELTTETRVLCLDARSRRLFGMYWLFVRPFSGLIRRECLHAIKRIAEIG
jgi:hypothetical protein